MKAVADQLEKGARAISDQAASASYKTAYAYAHPFMMAMGDVIMGWMLLWRGAVAAPKLDQLTAGLDSEKQQLKMETDKQAAFYHGQLQSARYFINAVLPISMGRLAAVRAGDDAVLTISERGFGG
jgi:hypothetical protein